MTVDPNYKYSELTDTIIAAFYEVYNELGFGFAESVYRNSMRIALEEKGLVVQSEAAIAVFFRGRNVGDFRADLVVNRCILLELKTAERIVAGHELFEGQLSGGRVNSELRAPAEPAAINPGDGSGACTCSEGWGFSYLNSYQRHQR